MIIATYQPVVDNYDCQTTYVVYKGNKRSYHLSWPDGRRPGVVPGFDRAVNIRRPCEIMWKTFMSRVYRAWAVGRRSSSLNQAGPSVKLHEASQRPLHSFVFSINPVRASLTQIISSHFLTNCIERYYWSCTTIASYRTIIRSLMGFQSCMQLLSSHLRPTIIFPLSLMSGKQLKLLVTAFKLLHKGQVVSMYSTIHN